MYQIVKVGGQVYSIAPVDNLGKVRQVHRSAIKPWVFKSLLVASLECVKMLSIAPSEEEEVGGLFVVVP